MFAVRKWFRRPQLSRRVVEVGWLLQANTGGFMWEAPRNLTRVDVAPPHAKSAAYCPAVLDHEARLFEIPCPFDLQLRFRINEKGQHILLNAAGDRSAVRARQMKSVLMVHSRNEWRHPDRPIIQVSSPYTFLADETVYMTQLPPFVHYRDPQWPGAVIGGRLPIHVWPRQLMWAFEWYDISKDLILKRGEPWFYVRFETPDASRPVRLVESEATPEVKEYLAGMVSVAGYVKRTFSLFAIARQRRPRKLVVPRKREQDPITSLAAE